VRKQEEGKGEGMTNLLHVVLQRPRYVVVDDSANIGFIHTHSESDGGHHYVYFVFLELDQ
jgi:hypothetical protein